MSEQHSEGWTWLFNSRKWHYFRDQKSLCGKWAILGNPTLEQGNDRSPDNCASCKRKRIAEIDAQFKAIHG
jgi:hypothetical protein